jgi:cellobiose-specific phosphotransferase system component IIB
MEEGDQGRGRRLGRSTAVIAGIIATLVATAGLSFGLLTSSVNIANTGVVTTVDLGIYTTQQATTSLTQIDWGTVSPGSSYTRTGYVRNNGSVGMTLSMTTTGWNPAGASAIGVSWNYDGRTLSPGQVLAVTWTLTIPSTISGVQSFSFNIVVTGSG